MMLIWPNVRLPSHYSTIVGGGNLGWVGGKVLLSLDFFFFRSKKLLFYNFQEDIRGESLPAQLLESALY